MAFRRQIINTIVLTGMTLGTAWAIRRQFGHEQGAACGAIGCVFLVFVFWEKGMDYRRAQGGLKPVYVNR